MMVVIPARKSSTVNLSVPPRSTNQARSQAKRGRLQRLLVRVGYREETKLLNYSTVAILALHWGTLHRTIRTKDAAIAGFGAEQRLAVNAFVEELAGVSWHHFAFGEAANRTYQHGFQNKLAHTRLSLRRLGERFEPLRISLTLSQWNTR